MRHFRSLLALPLLALAFFADAGQSQPPVKDQYGDPLPPGAVARLGTRRWRHDDTIAFAAFLPDGKSVISVSSDRTIRVLDFPSGKELRRIDVPVAVGLLQKFGLGKVPNDPH
jgi:WD40 repeat protein